MSSVQTSSDQGCCCADWLLVAIGACYLFKGLKTVLLLIYSQFGSVDLRKYGPGAWAVITGTTDGIGKGFAEELAKRGFNIYQISRSADKLSRSADELTEKYGVQVVSRTWDFASIRGDFKEFVKAVGEDLHGKDIAFLVNNVGAVQPGYFHELEVSRLTDLVTINCLPITYLTRTVLLAMKLRERPSAIINLSSVSAISPIAGSTLYSATKKFDDFFTELLAADKGNIVFMSLRPGYVLTNMTRHIPNLTLMITPNECAESALRDLGLSLTLGGHLKHKYKALTFSLLPEWKICELSMSQRIGAKYKKYAK
mmetsp:Transcript_27638/g.49879  ORF Transcript_27638/g.49879 Transcript_27638/m.49879 type:complete len:312 (-) Transcript_27638:149-1084(-)